MLSLFISGDVEKFVTVTPKRVSFKGIAGQKLTTNVSIIPEKKYRFKILDLKAKYGMNISYSLDKRKYSDIGGYVLTVTNLKTNKGVYHDVIYLNTDSKIQSKIKINIYGNIMDKDNNTAKKGKS